MTYEMCIYDGPFIVISIKFIMGKQMSFSVILTAIILEMQIGMFRKDACYQRMTKMICKQWQPQILNNEKTSIVTYVQSMIELHLSL